MLRRHKEPETETVCFGDCRLNFTSRVLTRGGQVVALMPKEYRLLEYLLRNRGRALSRDMILEEVWGDDIIVTERSVDRCITTLRSKVEATPANPAWIKTIRDVGYRFDWE